MALDSYSPEYETFLEAVNNGSIEEVEEHLIIHPEFLDLADSKGRTPVHHAAMNGRDSTVKLLLQQGSIALNSPDNDGWSSLHYAALHGRDSTVGLLLQRGRTSRPFGSVRSLDSTNNDGRTPLHLAAWIGSNSMVELLLQQCSTFIRSLDSTDITGMTPLHLAAWKYHDSTLKILKAVGAIVSDHEWLSPRQIEMLQQPIPEETIVEIRFRIYFSRSLLSHLL